VLAHWLFVPQTIMLFHQAIEQRLIAAPPYLEGRLREKDEVIADLLTEHIALKKSVWTALNGVWVEPDKRDQVVDFVNGWSKKTRLPIEGLLDQVGLAVGKFYDWRKRYGEANQHNGKVPRDFWLLGWEKQKVLEFQLLYPDLGYRRLTHHDDRRRCRCDESGQCMADPGRGRANAGSSCAWIDEEAYRLRTTGGVLRKSE